MLNKSTSVSLLGSSVRDTIEENDVHSTSIG